MRNVPLRPSVPSPLAALPKNRVPLIPIGAKDIERPVVLRCGRDSTSDVEFGMVESEPGRASWSRADEGWSGMTREREPCPARATVGTRRPPTIVGAADRPSGDDVVDSSDGGDGGGDVLAADGDGATRATLVRVRRCFAAMQPISARRLRRKLPAVELASSFSAATLAPSPSPIGRLPGSNERRRSLRRESSPSCVRKVFTMP